MSARPMIAKWEDADGVVSARFLRETGLLWKINHDLLHPLGLALSVGVGGTPEDINDDVRAVLGLFVDDEPWTYPDDINEQYAKRWAEFVDQFTGLMRAAAEARANGVEP